MFEEFQKLIDNKFTKIQVREIMEALYGYKVSRLHGYDEQKDYLIRFCEKYGLNYVLGNYKVKDKVVDEKKGEWSNIGVKVDLYEKDALWYIYIGKNKNDLLYAREYDFIEKNDPHIIGQLLKIPECCTSFFEQNKGVALQYYDDEYVTLTLENSPQNQIFDFRLNYLEQYFDSSLISHYLCSFNCTESLKKANDSLEIVKYFSKDLANLFEQDLKRTIIYDNKKGVYSLKGYWQKNEFYYNPLDIKSTSNSFLYNLLKVNSSIEVDSNYIFNIGNMHFEGNGRNSPILLSFQ